MKTSGPALPSGTLPAVGPTRFHAHNTDLLSFEPTTPDLPKRTASIHPDFLSGCDLAMLEQIALNKNTSAPDLRRLAKHVAPEVRASLAENPNTPLDIMMDLAADENPDVRYQLAENHSLSMQILQRLAEDDNPYVSCRAQRTIMRIEEERDCHRIGWTTFRRARSMKALAKVRCTSSFFSFGALRRFVRLLSAYTRSI